MSERHMKTCRELIAMRERKHIHTGIMDDFRKAHKDPNLILALWECYEILIGECGDATVGSDPKNAISRVEELSR